MLNGPAFRSCARPALVAVVAFLMVVGEVLAGGGGAHAQWRGDGCQRPAALEETAFRRPMTFSVATNKGNMSTSVWIAAVGEIGPETPRRFREFLEAEDGVPGQIVLHSPGGNLSAGLALGRMFRTLGLTAHIGQTKRTFESHGSACDTWYDEVEAGVCASSCAYAFLGGQERFVTSPYYPTMTPNVLGFHQFYGGPERGKGLLTTDEVSEIEATTMSVAQVMTGKIVLYAIEMGIDPRIVAFASSTPSDDLYFPTETEIVELAIASGSGLSHWFMEPYAEGLVTAAKPHRSDSMLEQVTAYCRRGTGEAYFLITMDLATPSYPNPDDLPLNAVEIVLDDQPVRVERRRLTVRYGDGSIFITVPVEGLKPSILAARKIGFRLDAARVMGGFNEGNQMDDVARQALALAWRNCI
jgi:hypothetical protein